MTESQDNVPLSVLLGHLQWNLQRFREMLDQEPTPYFRDASLQRFEFTLISVLKCIAVASGRDENEDLVYLIDHAVQGRWMPEETDCADILNSIESLKLESRASEADTVYKKLPGYYECFEHLYQRLLEPNK